MKQAIFLFVFVCGLFGLQESFADELDLDYGEYASPGNVWIEITHSAANPPPWTLGWWWINNLGEDYPKELKGISDERELIKKFFAKFDITVFDSIQSDKNAQTCEGEGCLFGTYHLLISQKDREKFQDIDFKRMTFIALSPLKQIKIGIDPRDVRCKDDLKLIFKLTDGSPACVKLETVKKLIKHGWASASDTKI